MLNTSKRAWMIASYTAIYLILAWLQINLQLPLGPFAYLLYPALLALFIPAPALALVGLADTSWLLGPWPNNGGFFMLIAAYTVAAFWLTKGIANIVNSCVDMQGRDAGTLRDMSIQGDVHE